MSNKQERTTEELTEIEAENKALRDRLEEALSVNADLASQIEAMAEVNRRLEIDNRALLREIDRVLTRT